MARRGIACLAAAMALAGGCGGGDNGTAGDGGGEAGGEAGASDGGSSGDTTAGDAGGPDGGVALDASDDGAEKDASDARSVCAAPYSNVFRFLGATSDGWSINRLSTPFSLVPGTAADGGTTGTLLGVDPAEGNPAPGSLKLNIPFDNPGEQLILQLPLGGPTGVNLTGAMLSAMIRLDSLANGAVASAIQVGFAMKSVPGLYTYAAGPTVNLQTGSWLTIAMSADTAPIMNSSFDNCTVLELDVLIGTGSSGTYGAAVIHVDTIAITSADAGVPPEPEGGAPVTLDASADGAQARSDGGGEASTDAAVDAPAAPPDATE